MTALDIFNYDGREVRTSVIDGEACVLLADVLAALGMRSMPAQVAQRLPDGVRRMDTITDRLGRSQPAVFVTEPGLYRVVLRSDSPKADPFIEWVTADVLPAIRKTGRYGSDAEMLAALPSSKILILAAEAAQRAEAAEAKIALDAPKVMFAEAVAGSDDSVLVARLANVMKQNGRDIGQNRLYALLREDGYLGKRGENYNRPTQKAMDLGLFEVVERTVQAADGSPRLAFTTKVTGKGQQYFINRYARVAA